jgi:hypothetical protein
VLDDSDLEFVELILDFSPSPSGTGLYFLQEEEAHRCYLVCAGCSPRGEYSSPAVALITFWGVVQTIFGYPNVDAWESDPRLSEATGAIYEVVGSRCKQDLIAYNRRTFETGRRAAESSTDRFFDSEYFSGWPLRHYFVAGHDGSCQALARHSGGLTLQISGGGQIAASAPDCPDPVPCLSCYQSRSPTKRRPPWGTNGTPPTASPVTWPVHALSAAR